MLSPKGVSLIGVAGLSGNSGALIPSASPCPWLGNAVPYYALSCLPWGALAADGSFTAQTIHFTRFVVGRNCTMDRLAIVVIGSVAGARARWGVYDSDDDTLYPRNLLGDVGDIDIAVAGEKIQNINVQLTAGRTYWTAFYPNATVTSMRRTASLVYAGAGECAAGSLATNSDGIRTVVGAYGALPAIALPSSAPTSNVQPRFWARFSA